MILGAVWLVAGWQKVLDPAESVRAARAYDMIPEPLVLGSR